MLRIGYVRLRDARSSEDTATLKACGCHVVRAEEPAPPGGDEAAVLYSILDFIGEGDQLVVTRLDQLGHSTRNVLRVIDRLEARNASLFVVEPESMNGRAFDLCDELTLGRAAGCSVTIDDDHVSQVHARIFHRSGQLVVEDLGSLNGTYMNRARVMAPMAIGVGDRLQVGDTVLEVA